MIDRLKEIRALSKSNYFDYANDHYLSESVLANIVDELLQMVDERDKCIKDLQVKPNCNKYN